MRETRTQTVHWWLSLWISESRLCAICNSTLKIIKRRIDRAKKNKDRHGEEGKQWKDTEIQQNNYLIGITREEKTACNKRNTSKRAKAYDPAISCRPRKTTIHRIPAADRHLSSK
jgi:hypothetical protein